MKMGEESPLGKRIEELLQELHGEEVHPRERAALAKLKVSDDRVISALESLATQDPNEYVRLVARNALLTLEQAPPVGEAPPPRQVYKTQRKLTANHPCEFIFGFIGWFVINGFVVCPTTLP